MEILECIFCRTKLHGKPFMICVDFNCSPLEVQLAVSIYHRCAKVVSSGANTFLHIDQATELDFMVVDSRLTDAVVVHGVDMTCQVNPHKPVHFALARSMGGIMVSVHRPMPNLPVGPPIGPRPLPQDWDGILAQTNVLVEGNMAN